MPDLGNRSGYEERLAKDLARLGRSEMADLAGMLGEPPDQSKVTDSWWAAHKEKLAAAAALLLLDVFLDGARAVQTQAKIEVIDWTVVQVAALEWSQVYSRTLAEQLTGNTKKGLAALLLAYGQGTGWGPGQLQKRIGNLFGPSRAATISITEVTRANTAGERKMASLLQALLGTVAAGAVLVPIHMTANDERVCGVCGPRHGKQITDGVFPPLHGRCRCWVDWRLGKGGML